MTHRLLRDDLPRRRQPERRRTGLPLTRFEIGRSNLVEDTVTLFVYFDEPPKRHRVRDSHLAGEAENYLVLDGD